MFKKSFALLLCLVLCMVLLPLTAFAGSIGYRDLIATLGTDKPSYSAGAPVTFHASLFNPTGYPIGNIEAELILPEGFRFLSGDGATAFSLAAGETRYWEIRAVQGGGTPATGDSGAAIFWLLIPAALFTAVLVLSGRRKTRFIALAVCAILLLGGALPSAFAATTQESFSVGESFIIGGTTQTATLNVSFDYSYTEEDSGAKLLRFGWQQSGDMVAPSGDPVPAGAVVLGPFLPSLNTAFISLDNTAAQSLSISGTDAADVTINHADGAADRMLIVNMGNINPSTGSKSFMLTVSEPGKADYSYDITVRVIQSMTFSYTGPAVPISDASSSGPGAGAIATLAISAVPFPIQKVEFSIDSGGISHTWVSDLKIFLRSAADTSILLIDRVGGNGHNFSMTFLDDDAVDSIQAVSSVQAPFAGTFRPANPLSGFIGENANGDWQLIVQDFATVDIGNIHAFSVTIYY